VAQGGVGPEFKPCTLPHPHTEFRMTELLEFRDILGLDLMFCSLFSLSLSLKNEAYKSHMFSPMWIIDK
jgi:hypothetical protein